MKIGIDISQTAFVGTGVARYTQNLVKTLLKIDQNNEYRLFFSSLRQKSPLTVPQLKTFKIPPTILEILWNRAHLISPDKFIGPIDVFHSSDWTQPPFAKAKVTTIHDLVCYLYPNSLHPKILQAQKRRLTRVKKEIDLIIAVSESTKKDIIQILGISEDKIRVIYEGVEDRFNQSLKKDRNKIERVLNKYKIDKAGYILSVGTLEPRKNIPGLIKAYNLLPEKISDKLVIAGKFGWGEPIENNKNIIFTGYVSDEDLPYLYAGAGIFVYPSFYEGFGLPVLEAMATGIPVICSNTSSLPEIGGEAVIYINPENTQDILEGILKGLKNIKELSKKSLVQAKKFSWEKCALETLKVYEEVYQKYN